MDPFYFLTLLSYQKKKKKGKLACIRNISFSPQKVENIEKCKEYSPTIEIPTLGIYDCFSCACVIAITLHVQICILSFHLNIIIACVFPGGGVFK